MAQVASSDEEDEPDDDELPAIALPAALVKAMDLSPGEEVPVHPIPPDTDD